ncbi:SDR family oxidoreductase [Nannocystaceae bacterium ST9]
MQRPPIAVVGVSALFPGSQDATGFWTDIRSGADLLTEVPATHWLPEDYYDPDPSAPDKTYAKRGGFIPHVDFDAAAWGVPPKIIKATDTSQLLGLIVAEQVLRDAARGQFESMDRSRISVILGVTSAQELLSAMISRLQKPIWVKSLRDHGVPEDEVQAICQRIADHYTPWEESSFPGLLGNVVAGRIANRLNLGGTNCVTDAACASTFAAVNMAAQELYLGDSDLVITGGVDTLNDIFMFMCFSKTPALSASGDCRPFSDAADGTMLGEGLGMVALERLDDAERNGHPIYAVLQGIGSSSDGKSKSVYAPVSEGQAKALRRAQANAGFAPRTVELIEAHGTGTKAGDAAEFAGLKLAFPVEDETQWCAIGSVKSQIGHTKAAAGAAGLFKAVMALHHKVLPPTIKIDRPNPKLDIENTAFYLNTQARPWIRGSDHLRRAGVSAFGFGGSNFHLLLEEYAGSGTRAELLRTLPVELITIAGADANSVAQQARRWAARCGEPGILRFAAWTTQHEFDAAAPARLALIADDAASLKTKLERAATLIEGKASGEFELPDGTSFGMGDGARAGGVGLLFPGQGSQYVQMGADLAMNFAAARGAWDRAADLGLGLERIVFPIPRFDDAAREADELALRATQWAQPAIGCASAALLAMLRELGIEASAVAGHSFGEVTALHAAGVLSETDMLKIARRRGELMAEAGSVGRPGTMSAVVASEARVRELLAGVDEVVLANLNAPNQTVISGPSEAIAEAERVLEQAGVKVRRLPVASAFHSPVVAASAEPFTAFLAELEFAPARLPVYAGESAAPYESEPAAVRARLGRQIAEPVRFTAMVEAMADAGIHTFVEVGPGAVLTNLVGQILAGRPHAAVALDRKGGEGTTALLRGLARLAALGVPMRLAALWTGYGRPQDPATRTQPKLAVPLCGSNPEKPYPPPGGAAELPAPNPPRPIVPAYAQVDPVPTMEKPPVSLPFVAPPVAAAPQPEPAPAPRSIPMSEGWLAAWQEAQRQTAQTHALVHQAMASSHAAYLRATESSLQSLAALAGGGAPQVQAMPMQVQQQPAWTPAPMPMPMPIAAAPTPVAPTPMPVIAPAPMPVAAPMPIAAAPAPVIAPTPIAAAPKVDLEAIMLAVVAEKTGYPAAMLELSMDMESELGIDSIKRVEILAAVQEQAPGLPQVDAAHMGTLRTLGQIVEYMQSLMPASASAPIAAAPKVDLEAIMLAVVADKTGYPAAMLELSMDMESELGIDSIKRVEILAAVQEQAPGLPQVDAAHMGTLRTLGQIVEYMQSLMPASASAPIASAPIAAAPKVDLEAIMLAVVADKTGYPAAMLELSMDMESELGIDSIKRVEILAAVQEQAPGLPQVDAAHMGTLRTLGQIVEYMQSLMPGAAASKPAAAPAPAPTPAPASKTKPSAALGRYALELVASPALGLARLGLHGPAGVQVCGDTGPLGAALVAELQRRGVKARRVDAATSDADAVVFLAGLREVADEAEAIAIDREAFHVARTIAARFARQGGLFVTVQDTGGDFGLASRSPDARAYLSGLPALIKTAKQEWPAASLAAIDLERADRSPAELARAIADELLLGGGELEVALSAKGERRTLRSFASPLASASTSNPIGRGDVVVVSGGARGVTAACVIEWAARTQARFVLLGRTALEAEPASCVGITDDAGLKRVLLADAKAAGRSLSPAELSRQVASLVSGREVRATLAAVAKAGGEARYVSVDVQDPAALSTALASVRREWGPIVGLVHGAGVLADKRIAELSDEAFDRVFDTKIAGIQALLHATASDSLRVLCMFSSVSARCGNNGQVAYAMANELLNKIAQAEARRRGPATLVKSLGWGPWEGGMVSPQLRAHFAELGVPMIPLAEGARMFADELAGSERTQVELVLGGEPRPEALLVAGSEARVLELEVHIDHQTHAYLAGHSIAGTVVVPVVLAVEWFSRVARAFRPDLHLRAIKDIRVLKGIKLHNFEQSGDRLTVRCRQLSNGDGALLELELIGAGEVRHYRAQAEMARTGAAIDRSAAPQHALRAWGDAAIYGDVLFHGGDFQVIQGLEGVGEGGIAGTLKGVHEAGWKWETWQTDVAALDGGLQMALLWARDQLGGATLPMGIGELRIADQPLSRGPVRVVASCRKTSASQAVADVLFLDQAGTRLSELRNAQLVLRPDSPARPAQA